MTIRVLLRDHPHRAVALATDSHVLIFKYDPLVLGGSTTSLNSQSGSTQSQCMVEFASTVTADLSDYRSLSSLTVLGTLGLITINNDIFLCVVNGASRVATVKPEESVQQITSVEFRRLICPFGESVDLTDFRLHQQGRPRLSATGPNQQIPYRLARRRWVRPPPWPAGNGTSLSGAEEALEWWQFLL